ncbi:TolC family protein [Candidatus Hepatobacter penaei]|uniref:TolC family protein n=1 Tax=Candidatus Hepatobacter penaei TaxID=1274402 RepID=UPI0004F3DEAD|nr:TolC family protein [Candidatus Hepatobacter penaei]
MVLKRSLILCSLGLMVLTPLWADASNTPAAAKPRTWKQALQAAHAFNPRIKIAEAAVKIEKDKKRQAQGEWVPTARGTASYGVNKKTYDKPVENPRYTDTLGKPSDFGVAAEQNLFASFGSVARWQKTEAGYQAALLDLEAAESAVFFDLMQVILEMIVSRELKTFYESNITLSQTLLAQTRARARVGEISRTDVFMAEAKLAESEAKYVEAESRLTVAKTQFYEITGTEPSEDFSWPDLPIKIPENEQELIKLALHQNFSIKAEAFREKSARKEVQSQLSNQMLPSVDLQARAYKSTDNTKYYSEPRTEHYKDRSVDLSGTLSLKVPIPLGKEQAVVRQAEQTFNQSRLKRQQTQLNVYQATLQARNQQKAAQKSVMRYEIELKANKKALDAMQAEYAHGGRTFINVSEIQNRKESSYQNWTEARKREMIERLRILSLTGQLTARSLKLDVPSHDARSYGPWIRLAPKVSAPVLLTRGG